MNKNFFYLKFSKKKINSFLFFASDKIKIKKNTFENYEIYFIGDISFDEDKATEDIFKKIILNKNDNTFLRNFNSQFLIIIRDLNNNNLEVVNSRFASPSVFYSYDADNFILSNNLYILLKYRDFKKFSLDSYAVWHFFKFRRVFGSLTLDRNTKFLEAGSKLKFFDFKITIQKYFKPNFKKNKFTLNENAELLNLNLKDSINTIIKNKKKISLALSGGADTRLVLANIEKKIDCFNYTYLKNRESKTAEEVANTLNHNFIWKKIPDDIYEKNLSLSSLVNSSMYMVDGVHYSNSEFEKYDEILSGYGLDFMFQGMYLPLNKFYFKKKPLYLKILKSFDRDIINFFINNISYKTKGFKLENITKKNLNNEYNNELKIQLLKKLFYVSEFTDNDYDKYEYLSLSDYSRHYTHGGQLALSQMTYHSAPAFHNGLYELSNQLPLKYKFDARITKAALKIINPKLVEIINANTGFKLKYNSAQLTLLSGVKRIFNPSKNIFHRTWLNIDEVLRKELLFEVLKLKNSNFINEIDFIDSKAFQNFISDWENNKVVGGQTLLLILTLNKFLESIQKN